MNLPNLESTRQTNAPQHLADKIRRTHHARSRQRKIGYGVAAVAVVSGTILFLPRPAYATVADHLKNTLQAEVIEVTYKSSGGDEPDSVAVCRYHGADTWIDEGYRKVRGDSKVTKTYWVAEKTLVTDASEVSKPGIDAQKLLSGGLKWSLPTEVDYKGQTALYYKTEIVRVPGGPRTLEIEVFAEKGLGRILETRNYRDERKSSVITEYRYPDYSPALFAMDFPANAKKLDYRDLRSEIRAIATKANDGYVFSLVDRTGLALVFTKGGVAPNPFRPGFLTLNGMRGVGCTYAVGMRYGTPTLPSLGKNMFFQAAKFGPMSDLSSPAAISYPTWKKDIPRNSEKGRIALASAKVVFIPDSLGFLLPIREKATDLKWFRSRE